MWLHCIYNPDGPNWQGNDICVDGRVRDDGTPPPPGINIPNATGLFGDRLNGGAYLPTGIPTGIGLPTGLLTVANTTLPSIRKRMDQRAGQGAGPS